MDNWALYLDIEGASKKYTGDAGKFHLAVDTVLSQLLIMGNEYFTTDGNRLFGYQVGGDGILILSHRFSLCPDAPIAIGILLMQALLQMDFVAKVGISEGDFADTQGCNPTLNKLSSSKDGAYSMGAGLLLTFPVMGTALINSHSYVSKGPKGTWMAIDTALYETLDDSVITHCSEFGTEYIDWIHTRTKLVEDISEKTNIPLLPIERLEQLLVDYISDSGDLKNSDWGRWSQVLNNVEVPRG